MGVCGYDGCKIIDLDILPLAHKYETYFPKPFQFFNELEGAVQELKARTGVRIFNFSMNIEEHASILLYGSGANGKSVFYDIMCGMLGWENFSSYTLNSLTNENGYYRAKIEKKLVNYCSEISNKQDVELFKMLASGEPIEARLPYKDPFIMMNYAKLVFNCNSLPKEVEATNAFFRRLIIIPFTQTIPEEQQDHYLAKKSYTLNCPECSIGCLMGLTDFYSNSGLASAMPRKMLSPNIKRTQMDIPRKVTPLFLAKLTHHS